MKRRFAKTLAATFAALAVSAGSALAAGPVQSGTQSSSTSQGALAASSATQVQPSNENISVRVLSPGNDGAVSQSNTASSTADASNTAATTQNASQTQASGCGCVIKSGKLDDVLGAAMQAAGGSGPSQAVADPAAQVNDAGSTGTSANTAPTSQATTQASPAASGGSGVQSSQQDASTDQTAIAGSSATQVDPSNSNISVRVLSDGNDGPVSQSNTASSSADASNSATTTQGSSQTGGGSGGVQSSTQSADTTQGSLALSSAKQIAPSNSNISVRVLSPGNGGSVSQSNSVASSANATNNAPVTQTSTQGQGGSSCGCKSAGPAVQSVGQDSSVEQGGAAAASSAEQIHPSNVNQPVRVGSEGNDGSVRQSNEVSSEANASNTAPVTQTATQQQVSSKCGCSSGPAVQELGQSSEIGQLGIGLSSAAQVGASNESGPVRIASDGNGGAVSQSNGVESSADATNTAPVKQTGTQQQAGSGVQAALQESSVGQAALAASSATQIHPSNSNTSVRVGSSGNDGGVWQSNTAGSSANAENTAPVSQTGTQQQAGSSCGCSSGPAVQALGQSSTVEQGALAASLAKQIGPSNVSDPVRVASDGNDGSLTQSNEVSSEANASNTAPVSQTGTQQHAGASCGCSGPAVQALAQSSEVGQLGIALSGAFQVGASNESGPIRIASDGNGGRVSQSNSAESSADATNTAPVSQTGTQQQAGSGVQALGQESVIGQAALAASAVFQLPGKSRCGCGSSFGNSASPVRVWSDGNDGYLTQSNSASSSADASNLAAPSQTGTQMQASPSCSCGGLGVQALGQTSTIDQIAAALSATAQVGASNASGPVRVWSTGGGGSTRQSNEASSDSTAANVARLLQAGRQVMV